MSLLSFPALWKNLQPDSQKQHKTPRGHCGVRGVSRGKPCEDCRRVPLTPRRALHSTSRIAASENLLTYDIRPDREVPSEI